MAKLYSAELVRTKNPAGFTFTVPVTELWIVRQTTAYWAGGVGPAFWALERFSDDSVYWNDDIPSDPSGAFTHNEDLRIVLDSGVEFTIVNPTGAVVALHGYKLLTP